MNAADTTDAASGGMAKRLLLEGGTARVSDSQDPLVREISEIVRNASGLSNAADRVGTVAKYLSKLVSPATGNCLAEIYVRVWRFLYSYKAAVADCCEEDHRVPPGWFQPVESYEFDVPIPSDDLAVRALLIGLDIRPPHGSFSGTWGDLIVHFWRNAQMPVLSAEAAHGIRESELLGELCDSYVRETTQLEIYDDVALGPRTRKSDLQRWWYKSQVRFNVPCSWLTWRPYRFLWGRAIDGTWQFGHYEWDIAGMGPLTIRAYAKVIQRVWSTCNWCDLEVLNSGDYGKIRQRSGGNPKKTK